MRTLTLAAALALLTSPALAIDPAQTAQLDHLGHTAPGSPALPQSKEQIPVAQNPARASATAATRATTVVRKITRNPRTLAERNGYKRVSALVNFPPFFPGIGIVFVKPATLPVGPFLSFDRKDRLISTIYMVPLGDMNEHKKLEASVGFAGARVDHATMYFNEGHPGVDLPHYHYVLWHVSKKNEALVAK